MTDAVRTPVDVLITAAQLIDRDGWCQGCYVSQEGRRDLVGAVLAGAGLDPYQAANWYPDGLHIPLAAEVALRAVASTIGLERRWDMVDMLEELVAWNDSRNRHGLDVTELLHRTVSKWGISLALMIDWYHQHPDIIPLFP